MRRAELGVGLVLLAVAACAQPAPATEPQAETAPAAASATSLETAMQRAEMDAINRLPAGPGRNTVLSGCLACHSAAVIVQQRKDAAAWTRTIRQMVTWGAPLPAGGEEALAAYLAQHFGPAPTSPAP